MDNLELLRYPVGRFDMPARISDEDVQEYISILAELPTELAKTVENFDDVKFATQYREGGWTVEQVVAHIADAHTRAYMRFKSALEQNNLTVRPYDDKKVSDLNAGHSHAVQTALQAIYDVHNRWVSDLRSLTVQELNVTFFYPDARRTMSIPEFLAIFAWHTRHHFSHIKSLKDRMGW